MTSTLFKSLNNLVLSDGAINRCPGLLYMYLGCHQSLLKNSNSGARNSYCSNMVKVGNVLMNWLQCSFFETFGLIFSIQSASQSILDSAGDSPLSNCFCVVK